MFNINDRVRVISTHDRLVDGQIGTVTGWHSDSQYFTIVTFNDTVMFNNYNSGDGYSIPYDLRKCLTPVKSIVFPNACLELLEQV